MKVLIGLNGLQNGSKEDVFENGDELLGEILLQI